MLGTRSPHGTSGAAWQLWCDLFSWKLFFRPEVKYKYLVGEKGIQKPGEWGGVGGGGVEKGIVPGTLPGPAGSYETRNQAHPGSQHALLSSFLNLPVPGPLG